MQKLTAVLLPLWASTAGAAEIELVHVEGNFAQIVVHGKIVDGDGEKFHRLAENFPRASVALDSPGGLVEEALSIGAEIAVRGYATYTGGGEGCYSACALIWVAGARRYMLRDAVIGVHAAYKTVSGPDGEVEARETGAANAQIGAFLNEIGLSANAIRFFTTAGPDDFKYLTPEIAQRLDIDVYIQDGFAVETPAERPTPRRMTDTATRLLGMSSLCAEMLDLDATGVEAQGAEVLQEGHDLFGGETFAELIVEYTDRHKAEIDRKGKPVWCIESEDILRQAGIGVAGLSGPSFDCGRASNASERLICETPDLWARDRMLSSAYGYLRDVLEPDAFDKVRRDQRAWLERRENCSGDVVCATRIYNARLREMGLF